jgi:hypothetical protein
MLPNQRSSIPNRLIAGIPLSLLLIGLASLISSCRPGSVTRYLTTPTPVSLAQLQPQIVLDPATGFGGSFVQVVGTEWEPGQSISLSVADGSVRSAVLITAEVDAAGRFATGFLYPLNERWIQPGVYQIIAETSGARQSSSASFSVTYPATETPTPTITPFETSTPLPTFTPTFTPTDTPTSTPTQTPTPTNTETPTTTPTSTPSDTPTETPTPSDTPTGTATPTVTETSPPTPTPVVTATPTPVVGPTPPSPGPIQAWLGAYWDNAELYGTPIFLRQDAAIDFDWGLAGPDSVSSSIPGDNFSAKWSRTVEFTPGPYRFILEVTDGARLFIDEQVVIDAWREGELRTFRVERNLSVGPHRLRLDYFDRSGPARVRLTWEPLASSELWRGAYYANAGLQSTPVLEQQDAAIDLDWGQGSPAPGLPPDGFSVRWEREIPFTAGRYRFTLQADDSARIWIDDNLIIDGWRSPDQHNASTEVYLTNRTYAVRVEYRDQEGPASIHFGWQLVEGAN